MTTERLEEIMTADNDCHWTGDNAIQGLQIIGQYINANEKNLICGAEHDLIFSVSLEDICEAGITEEDAQKLRNLNWMIEYESLACFV
jgi:hypothetical protein